MTAHRQPFVNHIDSSSSSDSSSLTSPPQVELRPLADEPPCAPEFYLEDVPQWFKEGRLKLIEGDDAFLSWALSSVVRRENGLNFEPIEKFWADAVFPGATYQNEHGDTLLHIAIRHKRWKGVDWLILRGADIDKKNKHGHTPKWLARKYSPKLYPPLFKARLVQDEFLSGSFDGLPDPAGAQENSLPTKRPFCAEEKSKIETNGLKQDPLADQIVRAVKSQDEALFLKLVIQSSDLNIVGSDGQSPMGFLIEKKDWNGCSRLLDYGASLGMKDKNGFLWDQLVAHREEIMLHDEEVWDALEAWAIEAKTRLSGADKMMGRDNPLGQKQGKKMPTIQKKSNKKTRAFSGVPNSSRDLRGLPEPKEFYESRPATVTRPTVIFRKTRKISQNMG